MRLITQLDLVPWLRMCGAIPPPLIHLHGVMLDEAQGYPYLSLHMYDA